MVRARDSKSLCCGFESHRAHQIGFIMCNLFKPQCNPVIPKGFFNCKMCKGFGVILRNPHYKQKSVLAYICPVCEGTGYTDWIQNTRSCDIKTELSKFIERILARGRGRYHTYVPFRCPLNKDCQVVKDEVRKMNKKKKQERLERKYLCNLNC